MKKNIIGIDARLYAKTGVGVYIRNLLYYLPKYLPDNVEIYCYLTRDNFYTFRPKIKRIIPRLAPYQWHSVAEQGGFLRLLLQDDLDLMHFTYFSYPILYRRPFIATVHDTIMLEHKTGRASTRSRFFYELKHAAFRCVIRTQVRNAQRIIVPTQTVSSRLGALYGSAVSEKTHVISEGVNVELMQPQQVTSDIRGFRGPYFLYVGNFYPHKNVHRLIRAFLASTSAYPLYLMGPDDYFCKSLRDEFAAEIAHQRLCFFTDLPVGDLVHLYKHASALIHPSLQEGFCLPLIEAAYFEKPIIASDIPVIRELLGTGYLSFDPQDTRSITHAINQFFLKKVRTDYHTLLKKRTFERMTQQTVDIYKELIV